MPIYRGLPTAPDRGALALITVLAIAIALISFASFDTATATISCALGWLMLSIAAADARMFIIPDTLSLPSIPAGILASWYISGSVDVLLEHLAATIVAAALLYAARAAYYAIRHREGLGLGDVKLVASAGAWTGLSGVAHVIALACLLALSFVVLANVRDLRSIRAATALPFGAFLAPSIWLVWIAETVHDLSSGMANAPWP